jgi:arabinan endo-1,5-alpha-L-arabinosidase
MLMSLEQSPDVSKVDDTYYLLYSISTWGSQDSEMGFAVSTDLENWTDMGSSGVASSQGMSYNAIHGSFLHSGNQHYMVFGSFWSDIFMTPMTNIPTPKPQTTRIAYQPSGEHAIEAPFIFEHEKVWYLFFSAGKCCNLSSKKPSKGEEYTIKACRSRKPTGPFEDKDGRDCNQGGGTTILPSHDWVYAPGGQGVYVDPEQGPVLYYHYRKSPGRGIS